MVYRAGYDQFLHYSTTPGGARSAAGIVVGGEPRDASEVQDIRGIGSHLSQNLREGMLRPEGSISLILQSIGILALATRQAGAGVVGVLNEFDIEHGDDVGGIIHNNCKIDSLRLSFAGGRPLQADLSWKAKYTTAGALNTHVPSTDPVIMFYEGSVAGIPGAPSVIAGDVSINHNVDWLPVIDNTMTPKRQAKHLTEAGQVVTANFRLVEPDTTNISADAISEIAAITIAFVGTSSITLTLSGCKLEMHGRPLTPQAVVEHGLSYQVKSFAIA